MSALSAGGQLARHDESSGKNQISSNAAVPYLQDGFQHKKRLPDRSEPWASGLCQANLLHLLLKIARNNFILFSETGPKPTVSGRNFFWNPMKAAGSVFA